MDRTPARTTFEDSYRRGDPPWVIDQPQPAVVALEHDGHLRGRVLDLGCGTGEHTILLTRLGYDVLGADAAPAALERARARAAAAGVAVRVAVVDALDPVGVDPVDTVLDSALFHVFDAADRARYVTSLARLVVPGGTVAVLALATGGPRFGPEVSDDDLRTAFTGPAWAAVDLRESTYRGRVGTDEQSAEFGVPVGGTVDLPAWLAIVRRAAA